MRNILTVLLFFITFQITHSQETLLNKYQQQELDSVIKVCVKKIDVETTLDNVKYVSQLMERVIKKYDVWSSYYYLLYFKVLIVRKSENSEEAQKAYDYFKLTFDKALEKSVNDRQKSELYTLKGFLYLTILSSNPVKYGREYAKLTTDLFEKATTIYPKNPRPIYLNALFQDGMAKFFKSAYNYCNDLLLANKYFIAELNVYDRECFLLPTWGAEHTAETIYNNCSCKYKDN